MDTAAHSILTYQDNLTSMRYCDYNCCCCHCGGGLDFRLKILVTGIWPYFKWPFNMKKNICFITKYISYSYLIIPFTLHVCFRVILYNTYTYYIDSKNILKIELHVNINCRHQYLDTPTNWFKLTIFEISYGRRRSEIYISAASTMIQPFKILKALTCNKLWQHPVATKYCYYDKQWSRYHWPPPRPDTGIWRYGHWWDN